MDSDRCNAGATWQGRSRFSSGVLRLLLDDGGVALGGLHRLARLCQANSSPNFSDSDTYQGLLGQDPAAGNNVPLPNRGAGSPIQSGQPVSVGLPLGPIDLEKLVADVRDDDQADSGEAHIAILAQVADLRGRRPSSGKVGNLSPDRDPLSQVIGRLEKPLAATRSDLIR